ncbi:sulfotransferase domain-containing protein [Undibacterium sp. RuRC25W]|uniref:sulfotransferase domain-containing protein n=1 Tax=Undibacterium sp. RuRC25W TaxID=3413047 RepID=UPI003BF41827
MQINRLIKQARKQSKFLIGGMRPSAISGRSIGPKVLVNSVPKAGTNLLQELVTLLPLMRGKITRTLSLTNGVDQLLSKLETIKKGECAPGHIFFDPSVEETIKENGIRHILIVRDFRDVVYSNIKYLDSIHTDHPHNKYFSTLATMDEKIEACLSGNVDINMRPLPDLIRHYRPWMDSKEILIIRYENLVSKHVQIAETEIQKIVSFLGITSSVCLADVRTKMFNVKGLTFNAPGVEKWRTNFNKEQIEKLNRVLGDELEYFGYFV